MPSYKYQIDKKRIVLAFRKYTRLGLSKNNLYPFDAYDRIRGVSRNKEDALDLLAVYDTLRILRISEKYDVIDAVYAIYFDMHGRKPKKNEISNRVLHYAYEKHFDLRTIYRKLEYARKVYAMLRTNY